MKADFIVIGGGLAGLSFALEASKHGSVAVLSKESFQESSSAWAQGGISAVTDQGLDLERDSIESHLKDTLVAGGGLVNANVSREIIEQGQSVINFLQSYGVSFDTTEDLFNLGKEGGHSTRRILHHKDSTGFEMTQKLDQACRNNPNITFYDQHYAIDVITTGKLGLVTDDRVLGCYVLDPRTNRVRVFESDRVLLATGGCGKVYLYTTNPDTATGDGLAMAWRAGATVANMEFMQFHPTCFFNPSATGSEARSFLISEAVRGEGGKLILQNGKRFMANYDKRQELAPRDIVARAIDQELKRTGDDCVYLDVTHKPKGYMAERFPKIYQTLLQHGIDCEKQPIPVVPAAHYQCGGVVTDSFGKTSIRGLYAAGEVACTGFHGANRLASNSLLEACVIGRRAVDSMIKSYPLATECLNRPDIPAWEHGDLTPPDELGVIYHNWDEVRHLMWSYVSIVRTDNRLQRASTRLKNLHKEVRDFYWGNQVTRDILELRNLVTVASLIVDCAVNRKESRGLHYTLDYPNTRERFEQDTVLRRF